MTAHPPKIATATPLIDIDELEPLADWKEALQGKIERLTWCLNLHLLDGFDRDEVEQLMAEVDAFRRACLSRQRKGQEWND